VYVDNQINVELKLSSRNKLIVQFDFVSYELIATVEHSSSVSASWSVMSSSYLKITHN
jgi:hypothetical protein